MDSPGRFSKQSVGTSLKIHQDAQSPAGTVSCRENGLATVDVDCHWFREEDMFAGLDGVEGLLGVEVRWAHDGNSIDRILEQLTVPIQADVAVRFIHLEFCG